MKARKVAMVGIACVTLIVFVSFLWVQSDSAQAQGAHRVLLPRIVKETPVAGLPVTAEGPLQVLSYREILKADGTRIFMGEVRNNGTAKTGVSIRYIFYRGTTTIVLGGGTTILPSFTSLAPGAKAPFYFYAPREAWDRYELTIKPSYPSRSSDDPYLAAVDVRLEWLGHTPYIKGEIRNNGPSVAKSVRVGVTWYDGNGRIVAVGHGYASADIPVGMSALFSVWIDAGLPIVQSYELRLTCRRD